MGNYIVFISVFFPHYTLFNCSTSSKVQEKLKKTLISVWKNNVNTSPCYTKRNTYRGIFCSYSSSGICQHHPNVLTTQNHNEKIRNYLAIKLNCLKDNEVKFESHEDFLTRFINEGLVPKGLQLMLLDQLELNQLLVTMIRFC